MEIEAEKEIKLNFGKQELRALDQSIRNLLEMFSEKELDLWVKGELDLHDTFNKANPEQEQNIGEAFESNTTIV